jgi:hypothetical protein
VVATLFLARLECRFVRLMGHSTGLGAAVQSTHSLAFVFCCYPPRCATQLGKQPAAVGATNAKSRVGGRAPLPLFYLFDSKQLCLDVGGERINVNVVVIERAITRVVAIGRACPLQRRVLPRIGGNPAAPARRCSSRVANQPPGQHLLLAAGGTWLTLNHNAWLDA